MKVVNDLFASSPANAGTRLKRDGKENMRTLTSLYTRQCWLVPERRPYQR